MTELSALPCVLVVADRERVGELVAALSELPNVEVVVSSGGDDTIDLFSARHPAVVVLTASLAQGDAKSLIVTLRGRVPRAEVAIVVVGDDAGPVRTALDALDLAPDRFVTRPLSSRALRFAVTGGIDAVRLVRSSPASPPPRSVAMGTLPGRLDTQPGGAATGRLPRPPSVSAAPLPVPPSEGSGPTEEPSSPWSRPRSSSPSAAAAPPPLPPPPAADSFPAAPRGASDAVELTTRAALRARWAALADSMADSPGDDPDDEPAAPPPLVIKPRRRHTEPAGEPATAAAWQPGLREEVAPPREPTLILREPVPAAPLPDASQLRTVESGVVVIARTSSQERWSEPMPIPAMPDRELRADTASAVHELGARGAGDVHDGGDARHAPQARVTRDELRAPADAFPAEPPGAPSDSPAVQTGGAEADAAPPDVRPPENGGTAAEPRDFARELRAKMSMMAQRLFHGSDAPAPGPVDHAPRHDHHTEIDLSALGDEPALGGAIELEGRGALRAEPRELATSPGSWDSQVRERGLPDGGMIVRGVSDAAMLLAKMFAQEATGRIGFHRDEVETVVYFDHGRPVFASSNEPRDRMGELLLREGKITASQYERCQAVVAESGRRMGEILVDFGYLKRRELLPAVRRHVEDLVYSLFGWERGTYNVTHDPEPSAERIRLSRHPAALILEGIRRKLDRTSLERMIGLPSTVIEVRDRDRLGGIVHMGDLAPEERSALAAFDGQADLAQVARNAGVDIADVLPLAWGLCVLGLATARRADSETSEDTNALIGETDLAIDRERVRARWQLVTEADYFALLGVRRDATGFEIRRAYQSARRDFAADCFPGDLRRELARELDDIAHVLDEAFRVLRDDRLRLTYLANLVDG